MSAIHVKPTLLAQERIEIRAEGDLVVIRVGNSEMRMAYADAFKLSQWIRVRAKEAKRAAGDTSRHWSVLGTLHDDQRR